MGSWPEMVWEIFEVATFDITRDITRVLILPTTKSMPFVEKKTML